jgi:hypothetical protein
MKAHPITILAKIYFDSWKDYYSVLSDSLHVVLHKVNTVVSTPDSNLNGKQYVDYKMNVDMNVNNYQYTGDQTLVYTNNSPETWQGLLLTFSSMCLQPQVVKWRVRTITDPDPRVGSRIAALSPNEIGYLKNCKP